MLTARHSRRVVRPPHSHAGSAAIKWLIERPARFHFVMAALGAAFAIWARYGDRSTAEAVLGVLVAAVFAATTLAALRREAQWLRLLEHHAASDRETLSSLDRYDVERVLVALFRLQGFAVARCEDATLRRAADLCLTRANTTTLVRVRDWDDAALRDAPVRELRAAVAERGATRGIVVYRDRCQGDAADWGRSKGLAVWNADALYEQIAAALGAWPVSLEATRAAAPRRARSLLFLDFRLLTDATGFADWLLAHPSIEIVATTQRGEAPGRLATFDDRVTARLAGATPELGPGMSRFFEIQAFLAAHGTTARTWRWAAVDTEASAFPAVGSGLFVAASMDEALLARLATVLDVAPRSGQPPRGPPWRGVGRQGGIHW
jgi:hypothetical protein